MTNDRSATWRFRLSPEFGHRDVTEEVTDLADLRRALDQLAPANDDYEHNARWGDGNGFSHVRSALLKTSIAIPVVDGRPALGEWQQIVVINLDNRARERAVVAVICG